MLDTGAEFSYISASRLSKDMLKCLKLPSVVKCRGVGGEMVQVKGQIIRDVHAVLLTGTQMELLQLRLLVVVVPVILGVDFLSKLGQVTFDFNRAKLQVAGSVESVELLEDYNDTS